jgi:hypothetical protein
MSRNSNPFAFNKPITLDNLDELFSHHRRLTGGWGMTAGNPAPEPTPPPAPSPAPAPAPAPDDTPQRPEGVSEDEWNSLGDPGKRAIVRERNRADAAERTLAASRARPTPPPRPAPAPTPAGGGQNQPAGDPPKPGDQPDFAALIKQAVDAAVKPFVEREEQRTIDEAAENVRTSVLDAAKSLLHDATDALTQIDLTTVIDTNGVADPAKVKTALDDLVTRKPHLAKPGQQQRQAPPGIGGGAPANATEGEKVAAALARMQKSVNLRPPTQPTS